MTHLDLFSGIGGFSLAADQVFGEVEHTFVENDPFCTNVLKKHWPNATYYGDIRRFIADTESEQADAAKSGGLYSESRIRNRNSTAPNAAGSRQWTKCPLSGEGPFSRCEDKNVFILSGGFPCQPFSQAGRRQGTADDRYLWPEMFRCVQLTRPTWVIAENVRGLVSWSEGLVLEQVCADLESEGYDVQPIVVPAVAVNAPHRRDRVWIIGHAGREQRIEGSGEGLRPAIESIERPHSGFSRSEWDRPWQEVALATCHDTMDDGLPKRLVRLPDGTCITQSRWRREALKAYGNAIVPAVAVEIMKTFV